MNRISLIGLALVLGSLDGRAQLPTSAPALTELNDAAWKDSAAVLDLSCARVRPSSARLSNLSVRARTGTGGDTLIAGAVVQGTGPLPLLVRAIGPGLKQFGIAEALRDPVLDVFNGNVLAAQTNTAGPAEAAASAYVAAFPPAASAAGFAGGDAALIGHPSAGTINAHCNSASGATGVALLEFYDATAVPSESAQFVNLSARARVGSGEGVLILGFVIAGEGQATLLLRGVGPSLAQFNMSGVLSDPRIELYAGDTLVAANDTWSADAALAQRVQDAALSTGAFTLTSANDAALLVTLPAGSYTLQVRGVGAESGIAVAEIYQVVAEEFDAAAAANAVGLDLYRQLASTSAGQNLVLSPYSIESALALAYAGAAGDTRAEMARVLHLPNGNGPLQSGFDRLRTALDATAEASKATAATRTRNGSPTDAIAWNAANRLFGQQGYAFRDTFLALMQDGFAAPFQAMDFRASAEPARLSINAWVADQTRQKIMDLIPPGGVSAATRLVLVNALYLKAPWDAPFPKAQTEPRVFHPATGADRQVPTMLSSSFLGYATEGGLTIVTLDYLGSGLQFVILLPEPNQNLDAAIAALTPADFTRWANLRETNRREVILYLPKFTVPGLTVPLGSALRALGMKSAFDLPAGSANFDGIAPRTPADYLAISDVFHQTFIALDEEGTEAAAATAVVVGTTSAPVGPPPVEVHVDRPFAFAIQHRATGACLFFGRIADPK